MQSKSLMFALFMLVSIPLLIILSDHEVYFITMGIFLLTTSIKNIHSFAFAKKRKKPYLYDETEIAELEDETNLDIRKISAGTKVAKSLAIILFVIYCLFYTSHFLFHIIGTLICLYHINDIITYIEFYRIKKLLKFSTLRRLVFLVINVLTVILIIIVTINKFIKYSI